MWEAGERWTAPEVCPYAARDVFGGRKCVRTDHILQ